jgi:hypothetical protein
MSTWVADRVASPHPWSVREVGKRRKGSGDRAGLDALVLELGSGAKKGVFRYRSQEEANRDWDRWMTERVQRRIKTSAG